MITKVRSYFTSTSLNAAFNKFSSRRKTFTNWPSLTPSPESSDAFISTYSLSAMSVYAYYIFK